MQAARLWGASHPPSPAWATHHPAPRGPARGPAGAQSSMSLGPARALAALPPPAPAHAGLAGPIPQGQEKTAEVPRAPGEEMTPFLLLGPHAASDPWVWGLAPPTAQATPKLQKLYPLSPGS